MEGTLGVFISYASLPAEVEHRRQVRRLADSLRKHGVEVILDQYVEGAPDVGWALWCETSIEHAEVVLLVCTETYDRRLKKRDHGQGFGATWEAHIIYQLLYEAGVRNEKFIPIVFDTADLVYIPIPLRGTNHYVVDSANGYWQLYRRLTAQYAPPPTIGSIVELDEDRDRLPTFERPDRSAERDAPAPTVPGGADRRTVPVPDPAAGTTGRGAAVSRVLLTEPSRDNRGTAAEIDAFWASGVRERSVWFRPVTNRAGHDQTLIILVHGMFGDCESSWREIPLWLTRSLGHEISLLSFGYPAKTLQATDLDTAASSLTALLSKRRYRKYRDLIFLAHSAGGLVVKRMLLKNGAALDSPEPMDFLDRRLIICRTRRVINLAVPHFGGSWMGIAAYSVSAPLLISVGLALKALDHVLAFLQMMPGEPRGINRIAMELTWGRSAIRRDEASFQDLRKRLRQVGLPDINSPDVTGRNDRAIWPFGQRAVTELERRSSSAASTDHDAVRRDPFVVELVVEEIDDSSDAIVNCLMDAVMFLSREVDDDFNVQSLIDGDPESSPGDRPDARRTVDGAWLGAQAEVRDEVIARLRSRRQEHSRILVTGASGVGKSATIREIARRLAANVLAGGAVHSLVPIVMPLYRYGDDEGTRIITSKYGLTWEHFAAWWCSWVRGEVHRALKARGWSDEEIAAKATVEPHSLERLIDERYCVLIIDGVDDFLIRHPTLGPEDISRFVRGIERAKLTSQLKIVLGIRSSLSMGTLVAPGQIVEISRLTVTQARLFCDSRGDQAHRTLDELLGADDGGDSVGRIDGVTEELVLTPLILSKLLVFSSAPGVRTHAAIERGSRPLNAARVFERALHVHLWQSGLPEHRFDEDETFSVERWVDALTIVGFVAFSRHWGSWSVSQVIEAAEELLEQWRNRVSHTLRSAELLEHIEGFSLATRSDCLTAMFRRSLFFSGTAVRFEHREWEEFLAARHNALAVEFENISALSRRGSWTRMHFLTRDLLTQDDPRAEFSRQFVERVITCGREAGIHDPTKFIAQIPVGNMLGIVGHSYRHIRRTTFDLLLKEYVGCARAEIPALVEIVAMQTLGFRVTNHSRQDAGLLEAFVEALLAGYSDQRKVDAPANPLIQQSAAWWLEALAPGKHPGAIRTQCDEEALFMDARTYVSHTGTDIKLATNVLDETMQRVLVNMQVELFRDQGKIIPCATYILALVAADRVGVLVPDVRAGLYRILGDGEFAEKIDREIDDKCPVRGVVESWRRCRRFYRSA